MADNLREYVKRAEELRAKVSSDPSSILALLDERDSLKLQLQTAIAQNENLLQAVKEYEWKTPDQHMGFGDGDRLLVCVQLSDGDLEYHLIKARVDEDGCELRDNNDEGWGWSWENVSLWMPIPDLVRSSFESAEAAQKSKGEGVSK